jgi:outer membrane protein OmpA-like peptidoglycan-associated protein
MKKMRNLQKIVVLFVILLVTANTGASELGGNIPAFAPVEIGGALGFHIRYLHRQGVQGTLQPLTSGSILRSGDSYGIEFTPFSNCYVYIFQLDGSNKIEQLFPGNQLESLSQDNSNPVQEGKTYHVPSDDKLFQITPSSTLKHLYFLASSQRDTLVEDYYHGLLLERARQNALREALFHTELLKRLYMTHLSQVVPVVESGWIEKQPLYIPGVEREIFTFFDFPLPANLQSQLPRLESKGFIDYGVFERIPKVSLLNLFAEQSDQIVPEAYPLLHEYGKVLQQDLENMVLVLAAHTDNRGSEKENLELSRSRAEAIKRFFRSQFQIAADRLFIQAYGGSKPMVSNETAEGRRLNNRIELIRVK